MVRAIDRLQSAAEARHTADTIAHWVDTHYPDPVRAIDPGDSDPGGTPKRPGPGTPPTDPTGGTPAHPGPTKPNNDPATTAKRPAAGAQPVTPVTHSSTTTTHSGTEESTGPHRNGTDHSGAKQREAGTGQTGAKHQEAGSSETGAKQPDPASHQPGERAHGAIPEQTGAPEQNAGGPSASDWVVVEPGTVHSWSNPRLAAWAEDQMAQARAAVERRDRAVADLHAIARSLGVEPAGREARVLREVLVPLAQAEIRRQHALMETPHGLNAGEAMARMRAAEQAERAASELLMRVETLPREAVAARVEAERLHGSVQDEAVNDILRTAGADIRGRGIGMLHNPDIVLVVSPRLDPIAVLGKENVNIIVARDLPLVARLVVLDFDGTIHLHDLTPPPSASTTATPESVAGAVVTEVGAAPTGVHGAVMFEGNLPDGPDATPLYRGVPRLLPDGSVNPAYLDGLRGIVPARGDLDLDYDGHTSHLGSRSDATSWSRNQSIAAHFAGTDGLIMEWRTGAPPEDATWRFKPTYDLDDLFSQVLIQGTLTDARAIRHLPATPPPTPPTPEPPTRPSAVTTASPSLGLDTPVKPHPDTATQHPPVESPQSSDDSSAPGTATPVATDDPNASPPPPARNPEPSRETAVPPASSNPDESGKPATSDNPAQQDASNSGESKDPAAPGDPAQHASDVSSDTPVPAKPTPPTSDDSSGPENPDAQGDSTQPTSGDSGASPFRYNPNWRSHLPLVPHEFDPDFPDYTPKPPEQPAPWTLPPDPTPPHNPPQPTPHQPTPPPHHPPPTPHQPTPQPNRPTPPQVPAPPNAPQPPHIPQPPSIPTPPQQPNPPHIPVPPNMPTPPHIPVPPNLPEPPQLPRPPHFPGSPQFPTPPQWPTGPSMPQQPTHSGAPQWPADPGMPQVPAEPSVPRQPSDQGVPQWPNGVGGQHGSQEPTHSGGSRLPQWLTDALGSRTPVQPEAPQQGYPHIDPGMSRWVADSADAGDAGVNGGGHASANGGNGIGGGAGQGFPGGAPMMPPPGASGGGNGNGGSRGSGRFPRASARPASGGQIYLRSHSGFGEYAMMDPVTGQLSAAPVGTGAPAGVFDELDGLRVVFYRDPAAGLVLRVGDQVIELDRMAAGALWERSGPGLVRLVIGSPGDVRCELRYSERPADSDLGLLIRDVLSDSSRRLGIFG
ncbi:hypothetical protein ACWELJ_31295 [Nocardia sp. NPDC004582]